MTIVVLGCAMSPPSTYFCKGNASELVLVPRRKQYEAQAIAGSPPIRPCPPRNPSLSVPTHWGPKGSGRWHILEGDLEIAILRSCSMRHKTIRQIHLEANLPSPGDGPIFLVFQEDQAKDGRRAKFGLPKTLVNLISLDLTSARRSFV